MGKHKERQAKPRCLLVLVRLISKFKTNPNRKFKVVTSIKSLFNLIEPIRKSQGSLELTRFQDRARRICPP